MPFISNDPDMQRLIEQKAATTSPEKLCEELEALHDGLHDMKSQNAALFKCLKESKDLLQRLIALERKRGPDGDYIVGPLCRQNARIVECIGRVKGIIQG